jgi:hypothetical protein
MIGYKVQLLYHQIMLKRSALLTAFAILLTLLPLSPRDIWDDFFKMPLYGLGVPYIAVLIFRKSLLFSGWWRAPFLLSSLLILADAAYFFKSFTLSSESVRILFIIWLVPLIIAVRRVWGSQALLLVLVCITALHGQWGIAQFVVQHDLGYQQIGETNLDPTAPAIAKFWDGATKRIRAYGPYPHANSFGGAAVIASAVAVFLMRRHKSTVLPTGQAGLPILWYVLSLGVLLSFSRAAWLAYLLASVLPLMYTWYTQGLSLSTKRIMGAVLLTFILFSPLMLARSSDPEDVAVVERQQGVSQAWNIVWTETGWLGVGPGRYSEVLTDYVAQNNVVHELWQLQPVHVAPLLVVVEWGVPLSVLLCALVLWYAWRSQTLLILLALSPLWLFDHYLATQTAPLVFLLTLLLGFQQAGLPDRWAGKQSVQ